MGRGLTPKLSDIIREIEAEESGEVERGGLGAPSSSFLSRRRTYGVRPEIIRKFRFAGGERRVQPEGKGDALA